MTITAATFTSDDQTIIPGVADAQSAQTVQEAGFSAAYLNGYDVVRTQLGQTNEGLTSPSEMGDVLRHVKENVTGPVIVDAESGFGNQLTTYFVAQNLERSGAAGLVINDQIFPAHTNDAEVAIIAFSDFVAKLKAAKDAFDDAQTLLFAELDGVQAYGADGLAKRVAYLKQHNLADVILVGHVSEDTFAAVDALAETQAIGAVINDVRDGYFSGEPASHFTAVFHTGAISAARKQAEQLAIQAFNAEVEAR
ncbi:hypothetical protein AYR62_14840 [Secundilactobacillus paracollinoides]|uniref:Carboxyvinyl-carboxyphosphonate phosphorylmutase n=1 Tax=Secundilactobacillus paracollinoides TaxID=240427 RepID=A0A1B2IXE9_9LACO|nr:isocitrate lyase/phosphoenolpyruvate mutase family protein [Secundilactobacillus paracollinoides]ANZ60841.1 hypothetical protein AYR61_05460 [Secundilactobacillus paracollinoides]ANZ65228.1 hypothetical protein AYR62_14840 [Secundilactobacillus paracollinoides]ANZ66700.1 hypothetical protein AYR63_05830 [Secundilactobacillus paracollinoides]